MKRELIGREEEKKILQRALDSNEAEMVSVIGRRRIGKTFLVNEVYKGHIVFSVTGIQNAPRNEQLRNFANSLKELAPTAVIINPPKDWLDAFFLLIEYLKQKSQQKKLVVFLDELPWMATHKSGFLRGLSYFWNSWAVQQKGTDTEAGAQIDLLIDRNDHVINLFEIKFHNQPYTLTKAAADQMREKMRIFHETTKTRKQLSWVFISTFCLKTNPHSLDLIAKSLTMDDLF